MNAVDMRGIQQPDRPAAGSTHPWATARADMEAFADARWDGRERENDRYTVSRIRDGEVELFFGTQIDPGFVAQRDMPLDDPHWKRKAWTRLPDDGDFAFKAAMQKIVALEADRDAWKQAAQSAQAKLDALHEAIVGQRRAK